MADYYCIDGQQSDDPLTETDPDECIDVYLSRLTQDETPETIVLVGYDRDGPWDENEQSYPVHMVYEEEINTAEWIAENRSGEVETKE